MFGTIIFLTALALANGRPDITKFSNQNLWEPSELCPDDDEHLLIPHESECFMFYYCEFGMKRIEPTQCAPGSFFSFERQVCVLPWEADCNLKDSAPQPYPNLWEPSDLCPPIHEHHLIPHETDCSKFYYCEYGRKRVDATSCAPGTLFSFEKQVCVHPWEANCKLPGPVPAPPTEAPSQPTYPNLWEPSDLCPPIHEHHLIPHETDCSKFYYCKYGKKRVDATSCAPGTLFSFEKQVCVHPWEANCSLPGPAPPVDPPAPPTEAPSQPTYPNLWEPSDLCPPIHEHHLIPHESDCSKFYYCEYGMKRIDATDCAPGTLFNYELQVCVHPRDSDCKLPGPVDPTDPPAPGPTEPSTIAPGPTVRPTRPTPVWTPEEPISTLTTEPPYPPTNKPTDAPVTKPPATPTPAPATDPSTTTTKTTTSTTTTTTSAPETTPCECDGGTDCEVDYDARCRDTCNLLPWSHATDCDKFWRCEGDKAVRVVCPEGLHFNPTTGLCDFICNAGCVRRHTTTTTYSDGLKIFVPFSEINGASDILKSRIQRAIEHARKA